MSPPVATRPSRGGNEVGVRGRRLKTCEPCGEPPSRGKKSYSTTDRLSPGPSRPRSSMDRRAVGIGRARTPAGAEQSSHHKVGQRQCRFGTEGKMETSDVEANVGIDVSKERLDVAVR